MCRALITVKQSVQKASRCVRRRYTEPDLGSTSLRAHSELPKMMRVVLPLLVISSPLPCNAGRPLMRGGVHQTHRGLAVSMVASSATSVRAAHERASCRARGRQTPHLSPAREGRACGRLGLERLALETGRMVHGNTNRRGTRTMSMGPSGYGRPALSTHRTPFFSRFCRAYLSTGVGPNQ